MIPARSAVFLVLALVAGAPCRAAQAPASDTGATVTVWGFIQVRETYRRADGLTAALQRARVLIEGAVRPAFSYRFSAEFRSGGTTTTRAGVALADAYVKWSRGAWAVTAGQFKTPFGREFLTTSLVLETADRAMASDSIPPRRDIGIMAARAFGSGASLSLGVFNGDGANTAVNRDSTVLVMGRATIRPVRGLVLGANVATYRGDSTRYGWDVVWESAAVGVKGEYLGQHRRTAGPDDRGWYLLGSYRLGEGLLLLIRTEDLQRYVLTPAPRTTAWTGGMLVRLGHERVLLSVNYTSRKMGAPAVRAGTAVAQLQLRF